MSIRGIFVRAGALLLFHAPALFAASPYVETFSDGMNGWTNITGPFVWRTNDGSARVQFGSSPTPSVGTLSATGDQFTAAFIGDYTAADISMIGFKFRAETAAPSDLTFRFFSGTNGYFRDLGSLVTSPGVWYQFLFSLENKGAGPWSGSGAGLFDAVLGDVTRIDIAVTAPSFVSSSFRVDDIVVDRTHTLSGAMVGPGGSALFFGDALQTNVTYYIEATDDLMGIWTAVQSIVATNRMQLISVTNSGPQYFWRLAAP